MRNSKSAGPDFRRARWGWLASFLLVGCLPGRAAEPTALPFETLVAHGVAATLTAAAPVAPGASTTPDVPGAATTPTSLPLPPGATEPAAGVATPRPIPTPVAPRSAFFTDARYALAEERVIGDYALRVWRNTAGRADALGTDSIATLSRTGLPEVQVEFFQSIHELTGTDITGDGVPEAILQTYSGGAHCCFGTRIYSLKAQPELVLDRAPANCSVELADLDRDGDQEAVTCDDRFAYTYCSYAGSPLVRVVLAFSPGEGYQPASPQYADLYAPDIAQHTAQAEQGQPGERGEWDATNKCAVLPLVLDLLYSGQPDQAWAELERLYHFEDLAQFRLEIEQTVTGSPLFVAP